MEDESKLAVVEDKALSIAYIAAAITLGSLDTDLRDKCDRWPGIGFNGPAWQEGDAPAWGPNGNWSFSLAAFVRRHKDAPAEALFRYAAGQGIHEADPAGWLVIPAGYRQAYIVFRETLLTVDRELAAEAARAAARAAAEKAQAPNLVRQSETILAQHGSLMERMDDPEPMVNLGGPVHAAEPADAAADQSGADVSESRAPTVDAAPAAQQPVVDPVEPVEPAADVEPAAGGDAVQGEGEAAPEAPVTEPTTSVVPPAARTRRKS